MRYTMRPLLILILLSGCSPLSQNGFPGRPALSPLPSPQSNSAAASPGPSASPSPSPGASPHLGYQASPQASPRPELPAGVAGIRLEAETRFLSAAGETVQLLVVLLDSAGEPIDLLTRLPLEWRSSRPEDFAVDAGGKALALSDEGFSEISVRLGGSELRASLVLNVSQAGGGRQSRSEPAPRTQTGTISIDFE